MRDKEEEKKRGRAKKEENKGKRVQVRKGK